MKKDKIRFHWINFDWFSETVSMKYSVGIREVGGYEDQFKMTFEQFTELVDTEKLRTYLNKELK